MSTERTIVRGFHNRDEEPPEPIQSDVEAPPVMEDDSDGINLTWIIWAFAISLVLLIAITTTSLIMNIQTRNRVTELQEYIIKDE